MRIVALSVSYVHVRRVGAELALHALLMDMKARGHTVQVITIKPVPRCHVDGMPVAQVSSMYKPAADVVIANAGLGHTARQTWRHTPVVLWAHNNQFPTLMDIKAAHQAGNVHVLANTHHMADVLVSVLGVRAQVLHPPVTPGTPVSGGTAVTMVNCSPDKGAAVFWDLAGANPGRDFIAVKGGYGAQDLRSLPNVTVVAHGPLEPVWARTRILLLPSIHESYAMVAVEAATRGIPAVARDLPGVREALGWGAAYTVNDWGKALADVDRDWDEYAVDAAIHAVSIDTKAELDAVAALLEALSA